LSNLEKYNQAFCATFGVEQALVNDALVYQAIPEWDSVGHMGLIAALEEMFDIMLETEDIIDFESYSHGKVILKKYGMII